MGAEQMNIDDEVEKLGPEPKTLKGFRKVRSGNVRLGDLVKTPWGPIQWAYGLVGQTVAYAESYEYTVYRQAPKKASKAQPKPTPDTSKALTSDAGKPPLACLPWKGLREVAMVQLFGKEKYGDFYNYKKGMELSRNASCAIRHITDYMSGEDLDPESKRCHLAHAAARLLFMLENLEDGKAIDDRYIRRVDTL